MRCVTSSVGLFGVRFPAVMDEACLMFWDGWIRKCGSCSASVGDANASRSHMGAGSTELLRSRQESALEHWKRGGVTRRNQAGADDSGASDLTLDKGMLCQP